MITNRIVGNEIHDIDELYEISLAEVQMQWMILIKVIFWNLVHALI